MFLKLAVRDALVVLAAAGLWWWLSNFSMGTGMLSDFTGVVAGVALAACAYVFHEWGHLAGAFAARGVVHPPSGLKSAYVFSFDRRKNTRGQFMVMSFGGFIATGIALWAVYSLLPDDELASRVARGGVLFLVFLGVTLELPLVFWSLVSRELPPIEVFPHPSDEDERASVAAEGATG
ncbi:MAG: hypothetical protein OSB70_00310 [Myxococcota bacterium]|nr:hypothetical protein [Myxococcota bacterium]